jgi:hypothetical protein
MTDPGGRPVTSWPASPKRLTFTIREFAKIDV